MSTSVIRFFFISIQWKMDHFITERAEIIEFYLINNQCARLTETLWNSRHVGIYVYQAHPRISNNILANNCYWSSYYKPEIVCKCVPRTHLFRDYLCLEGYTSLLSPNLHLPFPFLFISWRAHNMLIFFSNSQFIIFWSLVFHEIIFQVAILFFCLPTIGNRWTNWSTHLQDHEERIIHYSRKKI